MSAPTYTNINGNPRRLVSGFIPVTIAALLALGLWIVLWSVLGMGFTAQAQADDVAVPSQTGGRVSFAHFAPTASEPISTAVDIRINGTQVVSGFVFGKLTTYVELPVGEHVVEVAPTGQVTATVTYTLEVVAESDITLAYIGKNTTTYPLRLFPFEDDNTTPPAAGAGRLRLAHLAPLSPLLAPSSLDICTEQNVAPLVADLSYTDSGVAELPAGVYRTFIASGGGNCALPLVNLPPFVIRAGEISYAYAAGDGTTIAPTVFTHPDLTLKTVFLPQLQTE